MGAPITIGNWTVGMTYLGWYSKFRHLHSDSHTSSNAIFHSVLLTVPVCRVRVECVWRFSKRGRDKGAPQRRCVRVRPWVIFHSLESTPAQPDAVLKLCTSTFSTAASSQPRSEWPWVLGGFAVLVSVVSLDSGGSRRVSQMAVRGSRREWQLASMLRRDFREDGADR